MASTAATASLPSVARPVLAEGSTGVLVHAGTGAARARMLLLALGPALTLLALVAAAQRAPFPDTFVHYAAWVALLAWSPLPVSFPAVLLDADRDAALPHLRRSVRAVVLIPYMLVHSPARVEVAVSLLGLGAAFVVAARFASLF